MIPLIWIRGIIAAAVLSLLAGICYTGYSKIKHIGYLEAEAKYELVLKDYRDSVMIKLTSIENASLVLAENQTTASKNLSRNMNAITKDLRGKTLTIIKDGECSPSKTFSDSFGTINRTVNQSLKDK